MRNLAQVHSEDEQRHEAKVHDRHARALQWGHLEIAAFFLTFAPEQRKNAWNRHYENQDQNEVGMRDS